ncbi:MAG: peptidase prolyl oligopeptidase, partial [Candidatus Aminicenantes bacterium]|nr:peptidase prolyl oligopeptidase [Candidatus Aminicenantes bacterium]
MIKAQSFSDKMIILLPAAVLVLSVGLPLRAELPPLIPRAVLLEESQRGNPVLSPDGRRIAYCAPHNGVQNIWLKTVGKDDDRTVTEFSQNGIDYCYWQADSRHVLYFRDEAGNENTHLFQTDVGTGRTRDLTPLKGARAMYPIMEAHYPDLLLIHINARDERFFDLYRLDLRTGALQLDTENPGDVARFHADHRLRVRAADVTKPDNSAEVRVRDDEKTPWRTLIAWGAEEMNSDATGVAGFAADDAAVLVITSLGANAERLIEVNVATGQRRIIAEDPQFDVAEVLTNPASHSLEAVGYEKERMSWVFFDK